MMSRFAPLAERFEQVLVVALLITLANSRAYASEGIDLVWHAPAGCPTEADVRARIDALAGAAKGADAPLRAEATVTHTHDGRLRLELVVHMGALSGERSIEGGACDDLAGAAAVNIALLLKSPDALGATSSTDAQAAGATSANANALPRRNAELDPGATKGDAAANTTRTWRVLVQSPLAAASFGPLSAPTLGVAVAIGLQVEHVHILAEGARWLSRQLRSIERAGAGATADRVEASLRGCFAWSFGLLEVAPCLHVSLEHLWSRGTGTRVTARTAAATWLAGGFGTRARVGLAPWLALTASADLHLNTAQPRISLGGAGSVERLGLAAVSFRFGTEWIL